MGKSQRAALTAVLAISCSVGAASEKAVKVTAQAAKEWRVDLDFLLSEMQRIHPNPFHSVRRADFLAAAQRLSRQIPGLTRDQVIVEFARLIAMIGEGHTQLGMSWDERIGFGVYPFRLYLFDDGLFVRATTPELQEFAGSRIVKIGKLSPPEAIAAVTPITQRDNEMTLKDVVPNLLVIPEVLFVLGVCDRSDGCTFVVEQPGGRRSTVELHRLGFGARPTWVRANEKSPVPLPLYLRHRDKNFWFEYLSDSQTLYVQYNAAADSAEETVKAFAERAFRFADEHPVAKLIMDLRLNNGGDNTLNAPLVDGIRSRAEIDQPGRLFAIIGRLTFSAAMNCAMDLEKHTRVTFVGEPTGSRPNQYGDATDIVLPHSGITVRVSTRYWEDGGPSDRRAWIAPAISVGLSSDDFRNNRDPVMEKILALETPTRTSALELLPIGRRRSSPTALPEESRQRDVTEDSDTALGHVAPTD
ncbi:MAG: hypothetical protein ABI927_04755 [Gaiellaceae bacterium]